jgi:integrase
MPKKADELGPLEVSRLTEPGLHFVGVVAGLALKVSITGARSWILRATVGNRRRDIGLGGYPDVTLAGAREAARNTRSKIKEGIDPVDDARAARSKLIAEAVSGILFDEAAAKYITAHEAGWKNTKHASQWRNTLETYAYPVIGKMRVKDIQTAHVMQVLEPIWTAKSETASRVRSRIELVLDWAKVRGYRKGENPARWKGHIDKLLPKRSEVASVEHHAALPFREIGAFTVSLRMVEGMGARALEFAILTAARSGEVRGATWSEIDLDGATWTIPAERMKAKKEHRIPLSDAALELLRTLPRMVGTDLVFPSSKNEMLSDMTLSAVLRRMGRSDITGHGFRSTFRDWAGETTAYPREVIEHALAHRLKDKAEAAYQRGTLFDKRRRLMDDWAAYCAKVQEDADNVIAIGKVAA